MRQTTGTRKSPGVKIVKDIKRATCNQYSFEEKIQIVLDGLRGEDSIVEVCRREGISPRRLLLMVTRLYGSWQESACWRHAAFCDQ